MPEPQFSSKHPGTLKTFQAVGVVMSHWTFLEDVLDVFVHFNLSQANGVASYLCDHLTNGQKIGLIKKILDVQTAENQEAAEAVRHFLKCAKICEENRSFFAHSIARPFKDQGRVRFDKKPKSSEGVDIRVVSYEEINKIAEEMDEIAQFGARAALVLRQPGSGQLLPKPALPLKWEKRFAKGEF